MTLFTKWMLKYWWVALFVLSASSILEFNLLHLRNETESFQKKLTELKTTEKKLKTQCSHLKQELYSLNDKEFVTLLLMKNLGVVPEGQTKVSFR